MKLHPINHNLKTVLWCGPGALCTLTGLPSSVVMAALREVTGRKTIKGVSHYNLEKAALRLGLRLVPLSVRHYGLPTLARWTRENADELSRNPVVFNVSNHYVTVAGRRFNDNWTKIPVPLSKAPRRRARVRAAWRVVPTGVAVAPVVLPERPKDTQRAPREEATRLAREHGIFIDKGSPSPDVIWVYPPAGLEADELDRNAGDHACYDWSEALTRVNGYVEDLKKLVDTATLKGDNTP